MTDIIDQAQRHIEKELAHSLRVHAVIASNLVRPSPTGYCLNSDCLKHFEHDMARLFCGPACAQRFEIQLSLKR